MKENYRAWDIDIDTLTTPRDFIKAGILAPSSHNSQPWSFQVLDDNTISVSLELGRRLIESDKNDRQATISVGCAIANIEILADYHEYTCVVESGRDDSLATLRFLKQGSAHLGEKNHLANLISKRVTNRSPHEDRPLNQEVVDSIRTLSSDSLRIDLVTDHQMIQKLGMVAIEAGIEALESSGFRHELSSYLKSNSTRSHVGMPGFGLGFPAPLALLAPILMWLFNMEKPAKKQNIALFEKTVGVLVISTSGDTKTDWLSVGQTYGRVALLAARAGMATTPLAATIQIGEHYRDIQKILNLPGRPQFFVRIGFPTKLIAHSPRLMAEQVII